MTEKTYDVLISGAGPAGLTAAIACARWGLKTLIVERENTPGKYPRGETIHDHPILDEFLGEGFIHEIALHTAGGRNFN